MPAPQQGCACNYIKYTARPCGVDVDSVVVVAAAAAADDDTAVSSVGCCVGLCVPVVCFFDHNNNTKSRKLRTRKNPGLWINDGRLVFELAFFLPAKLFSWKNYFQHFCVQVYCTLHVTFSILVQSLSCKIRFYIAGSCFTQRLDVRMYFIITLSFGLLLQENNVKAHFWF